MRRKAMPRRASSSGSPTVARIATARSGRAAAAVRRGCASHRSRFRSGVPQSGAPAGERDAGLRGEGPVRPGRGGHLRLHPVAAAAAGPQIHPHIKLTARPPLTACSLPVAGEGRGGGGGLANSGIEVIAMAMSAFLVNLSGPLPTLPRKREASPPSGLLPPSHFSRYSSLPCPHAHRTPSKTSIAARPSPS